MKRTHATAIALMLAGGTASGVVAVTKTTGLDASAQPVSDAEITRRAAELDRFEHVLRQRLDRKPPAVRKARRHRARAGAAVLVSSTPAPSRPAASSQPTVSGRPPTKHPHRADPLPATDADATQPPPGPEPTGGDSEATASAATPVAATSEPAVTHSGSSTVAGGGGGGLGGGESEHESEGGDD